MIAGLVDQAFLDKYYRWLKNTAGPMRHENDYKAYILGDEAEMAAKTGINLANRGVPADKIIKFSNRLYQPGGAKLRRHANNCMLSPCWRF